MLKCVEKDDLFTSTTPSWEKARVLVISPADVTLPTSFVIVRTSSPSWVTTVCKVRVQMPGCVVQTVKSPKGLSEKISPRAVPSGNPLEQPCFLGRLQTCPRVSLSTQGTAQGKFFQPTPEDFSLFFRLLIIRISCNNTWRQPT